MLILTRRAGEAIDLETSDGPVSIRLMEHSSNQTRVGIDAPETVKVWREKLVYSPSDDRVS